MNDRAMLCRPSGRNTYIKRILADFGLREGANLNYVHYVVENIFFKIANEYLRHLVQNFF